MKRILYPSILAVVLYAFASQAQAAGTFSEGYRMGQLTKFSDKGYTSLTKTGEGQLLLGRESSPLSADYKTSDGTTVPKSTNPWNFSTAKEMIDKVNQFPGQYVWVKYQQHRVNTSAMSTDYEVTEIQAVTRKVPTPALYEIKKPVGPKSSGFRAGRIVKVSNKGTLIKTWEIMLQIGDAGNQFKLMSVSDEGLFNYAVACLKSGKSIVVHYVDKGIFQMDFNDTGYEVWKIEQAKDI